MRWFNIQRASIRNKLIGLVLFVSLTVLLVAGGTFMYVDLQTHRDRMKSNLAALAEVIARNAIASLAFRDPEAASKILNTLAARSSISEAKLILSDGAPFANFRRDPDDTKTHLLPTLQEGEKFTQFHLVAIRHLNLNGEALGTLVVWSDLRDIDRLIQRYFNMAASITLGAAFFALMLSGILQRWIARPIEELETLSHRISTERDYTLRATPRGSDEVARLASSINDMLEQIQSRNSDLQVANRDLHRENRERQRAEAELLAKTEELERSNIELQEFAYVASHDLQEPLRMVTMFTQLLKDRYSESLDEKAISYIDFAVDGATRMQLLIRDLLEYSRAGRTEIEEDPVDLNVLLDDVLRGLDTSIQESDASLQVDALPTLTVNRTRIFQLFQNLISNAIKFRSDRSPRIEIEAQHQNEFWKFSIRDNGIGFDPEYSDRIFLLFQRLHARQEYDGTGIGLALCKKIVTHHGGEIWVETEAGQGTTFFFTLPAARLQNKEKTLES